MSKELRTQVTYSVLAAAEALDVSEKTVRNELGAGRLRHARFGNRILIPALALEEWIDARIQTEYQAQRKYIPPGQGKKKVEGSDSPTA